MCNLSGYQGSQPDIDKLKILYMLGRERGKDSCGIVTNHPDSKQIGFSATSSAWEPDMSDSINHVKELLYILPSTDNTVVLQHNRKSSSGGINKDSSQPVIVEDKDGNPLMALIHNGTVKNTQELKTKFKVEGNFLTDSYLMAHLLYHKDKEEVLKSYEGAAVFVWFYFDNPNEIFMWKGLSIDNKRNTATNEYEDIIVEERPLFYHLDEFNNEVYFSSLEDQVSAIYNYNIQVQPLKGNTITTISNGKIIKEVKVNRKVKAPSYYVPTKYNYNNTYSNNNTKGGIKHLLKVANPESYIANGNIYYKDGMYYQKNDKVSDLANGIYFVSPRAHNVYASLKINNIENEIVYFYRGYWVKDKYNYELMKKDKNVYINRLHPLSLYHIKEKEGLFFNDKDIKNTIVSLPFMHYGIAFDKNSKPTAHSVIISDLTEKFEYYPIIKYDLGTYLEHKSVEDRHDEMRLYCYNEWYDTNCVTRQQANDNYKRCIAVHTLEKGLDWTLIEDTKEFQDLINNEVYTSGNILNLVNAFSANRKNVLKTPLKTFEGMVLYCKIKNEDLNLYWKANALDVVLGKHQDEEYTEYAELLIENNFINDNPAFMEDVDSIYTALQEKIDSNQEFSELITNLKSLTNV
jgi:predicted glutamine amidotransferase